MGALSALRSWLGDVFAGRPGWMNAMMLFCAYMAFVYVPWDFFAKPAAHDAEVWFGIMLTGGWAKLTEPLHWLVYAAGAYGFRRMRGWMWPWAALYTVQIALGMWVWSGIYASSGAVSGWLLGLIPGLLFLEPSVALWRARQRRRTRTRRSCHPAGEHSRRSLRIRS